MSTGTTRFFVPDGNEALRGDLPAIVDLVQRTARWVHPETFKALPVWAPHTARGMPLFNAGWTQRYTNTRKVTGLTAEKSEGNVAALKALLAALGVMMPPPKNWTVYHIWGYDDPTFSQRSSIVQDPRYFSCVGNMVWLPTSLKSFTDAMPEIKAMLRVCAFNLYGWVCEHESVKEQAALITSGWLPESYPTAWPRKVGSGVFPPNTAPFTAVVQAEILKRKKRIKAALANADFIHYPKQEVLDVLNFWKIELD